MRALAAVVIGCLISLAASSASAAVSIRIEGPSLVPGGLITLRTYATADGGETDEFIFGAINYPDAFVNSNFTGNSQTPLLSVVIQPLLCTSAFCVAFNQTNPEGPVALNLTDTLIATTTFFVDPTVPLGTVIHFTWRTTPSSQGLHWFGLTNAPGHSVTIGAIPEPGTAALLGLGVLGLALALRKESR